MNATLRNNIRIAEFTLVGAGALVMKDTTPRSVFVAARTAAVLQDQRSRGTLTHAVGEARADHRAERASGLDRNPCGAAGRAYGGCARPGLLQLTRCAEPRPHRLRHAVVAGARWSPGVQSRSGHLAWRTWRVRRCGRHEFLPRGAERPFVSLLHRLGARRQRAFLPAAPVSPSATTMACTSGVCRVARYWIAPRWILF